MTRAPAPDVQRAFRFACGSLAAVRLLLVSRHLNAAALQIAAPVDDHFFPAPLRHPVVLLVACFAPILTDLMALHRPSSERMKGAAMIELSATAILLLHQATFFYATWVIGFWLAVYLVWLAWSAADDGIIARTRGPFLASLLIAFFFLGGAVGKWTPGYWSGDVFYEVFLRYKPYVTYAQSQFGVEQATVQQIAHWLGRLVVILETALAGLIFLPARSARTVAIAAGLALWCAAPDLFEVSWLIIGLALAGYALAPSEAPANVMERPAYQAGELDRPRIASRGGLGG